MSGDVTLTLKVGSSLYTEWKHVDVTRSIEQLSGSFDLTLADKWAIRGEQRPNLVNQRCSIMIAGTTIITGYIDAVQANVGSESHDLIIRGRDVTGDLVDCAAIVDGQGWENTTLLSMATELCKPHGVSVALSGPQDVAFRSGRVSPGETIAEVLSRAAAVSGCLLVSDGVGGLLITQAGSRRASQQLRQAQILGGSFSEDASHRFETYHVIGQSNEAYGAPSFSQQIMKSATDRGARKGRVTFVQVSDHLTDDQAQQMANWTAANALAMGIRGELIVRGWMDGAQPWRINSLVNVDYPKLAMKGEFLIAGVTHSIDDRQGQISTLSLTPRNAYVPAPVIDIGEMR